MKRYWAARLAKPSPTVGFPVLAALPERVAALASLGNLPPIFGPHGFSAAPFLLERCVRPARHHSRAHVNFDEQDPHPPILAPARP